MDNLLAKGLTEPAIVVTTDSSYIGDARTGFSNLFNIILPFIEDNYNVSKEACDRSFAGLSMGGGITTNIINYDATKFGYYGVWSAGAGISPTAKNLGVPYILIGAGRYDFGLPNPAQIAALENTDAIFKNLEVAGAHDFNTWCQLFTIYARDYLWKPEAFIVGKLEKLLDSYLVDGQIDDSGIYNSLKVKLQQDKLTSFANQIKAQSGKHISSEAASTLLEYAERASSKK